MSVDLLQARRDADGWRGTFVAVRVEGVDEVCDLLYVADGEELDLDNEETFYVIGEMLDDHVAESLARMLNAFPCLLDELDTWSNIK